MSLKNLQLYVLRCVTERTQDEIEYLTKTGEELSSRAKDLVGSKILPTLPFEIVDRIFSLLYLYDAPYMNYIDSTLHNLIRHYNVPVRWRTSIAAHIPTVFTPPDRAQRTNCSWDMLNACERLALGPDPWIIRKPSPLAHDSFALASKLVAVIIGRSGFPQGFIEDFGQILTTVIGYVPWDDEAHSGYRILDEVRSVLPNLVRLDIIRDENLSNVSHVEGTPSPSSAFAGISSRLRTVRVPLQMVPELGPLLSNTTEIHIDHSPAIRSFPVIIDFIKLLPPTLIKLALVNYSKYGCAAQADCFNDVRSCPPVHFTALKDLSLKLSPWVVAGAILQSIDCQALESFTCDNSAPSDEPWSHGRLLSTVHETFPNLKVLDVPFMTYMEVLYALTGRQRIP